MSFRVGRWLGTLGLFLILLSCTALPETGVPDGEMVGIEALPSTDMVPLEWGSLVSVTPTGWQGTSVLWFQDDAGNIRAVTFDPTVDQLRPEAYVIRRR